MSKKLKIALAGVVTLGSIASTAAICNIVNARTDTVVATQSTSSDASQQTKLVDENVYVFTRADGSIRKIISSDWTKTLDVDKYTNFQSDDKNIPITTNVKYYLDGKEISAAELVGKSGRVTMRFEYNNTEKSNGYYIPYAVIAGLMLDNEHFKNVEVTNGKLINDGNRMIVAGFMLPGMQENLGISTDTFEIPSYLEISADTNNFELGMTVSIATNEIFKELDFSGLNTVEQLSAELNKLTDAMDQLVGGSSDLVSGIEALYEKASALPTGVAKLSTGALQLKSGTEELAAGTKRLDAGIGLLQSGVEQLYAGIKNNTDTYNTQLQEGAKAVLLSSLSSANSNLTLRSAMTTYCDFSDELTIANYDTVSKTCLATLAANNDSIKNAKQSLDGVYALWNGIVLYTDAVESTNENVIKGQLLAKINDEKNGLKAGSANLALGAEKIAGGTADLSDGLETLNESAPALIGGIEQLRDGSIKLSDGIKQFNKDGVQKLVSVYNDDIKGLLSRIQTIANIAKSNSKNVKYIYRTDEIRK